MSLLIRYVSPSCVLLMIMMGLSLLAQSPLPTPSLEIPKAPPLVPMVITAGGQRRLLSETEVEVNYDPVNRRLSSNRPGWWLINFPLERIRGFEGSTAELSQLLFDVPREFVRNWYLKSPGTPTAEPPTATGPAPIDLTPEPRFFVDAQAESADDLNPGTADAPLRTIMAAVRRAGPGDTIRVNYGVYRERVIVTTSGTAEAPIRIEGVRSAQGMPVIDGNDPVAPGAWKPTAWPGVYRADFAPQFEGPVSLGTEPMIERSWPADLKAGEFATNRASEEFLRPAFDGRIRPREGEVVDGRVWRRVKADPSGMMDLAAVDGGDAGNGLYWASTWVWVNPLNPNMTFDPAKAAPRPGDLLVNGTFRGFRATGAAHNQQVNKYRMWVNGAPLESTVYSTFNRLEVATPHPHRNGGEDDEWFNFPLREGWNHLLFQLDTTVRPQDARWRFRFPREIRSARTSAVTPASMATPGEAPSAEWISEYLLLGPLPAKADRGVYVRLPGDSDPSEAPMELAARGSELVSLLGDFVQWRGFEIRNGSQFQQRPQLFLGGRGTLAEGNLLSGSEILGISCQADQDRSVPPTVIRNNWILNSGNVGFGCAGKSDALTADNLNGPTPGRSTVIFEHNVIRNANWAGFPVGWSAGGSKSVELAGLVFRNNTIIGGSGPGVWLDWENFGNRLEGNLIRDSFQYAIGIEASPGPNLIANNVVLGLKAAPNFFSALIASWDSSHTWAVHNTVNGRWNGGKGWVAPERASGIDLGQGGTRAIRFGPQTTPRQGYFNNLVLGFEQAIAPRTGDDARGNVSESGAGGVILGRTPEFVDLGREDYRLQPSSSLNRAGIRSAVTDYVLHDFNGLLRHRSFPSGVGAFRQEPQVRSTSEPVIEIEYEDGTQKLINAGPPMAALRPVPRPARAVPSRPLK